jgi:hypothetical protein
LGFGLWDFSDEPNRDPADLHTPQRMFSAAAFRP